MGNMTVTGVVQAVDTESGKLLVISQVICDVSSSAFYIKSTFHFVYTPLLTFIISHFKPLTFLVFTGSGGGGGGAAERRPNQSSHHSDEDRHHGNWTPYLLP